MNYRQWKKNYKKKHGYNPPLEDDKRKQAKVLQKSFKQIATFDFYDSLKTVINGFANAFNIIGEAFINAGKNLKIE